MSPHDLNQLRQLARLEGVALSYLDMNGQEQEAQPATVLEILIALGLPLEAERDICMALRFAELHECQRAVEPVIVAWHGTKTRVRVTLPERAWQKGITCRSILEEGQTKEWPSGRAHSKSDVIRTIDGTTYVTKHLRLPRLPIGYHRLEFETASGDPFKALIIAAPSHSYTEPKRHESWGVFLPVYAIHSQQGWGAGNFSDWQNLAEWIGSQGARVMASLPLLAAFLDPRACEPSPYSPASRLFWNEFYIDVEQVPELAICPDARKLVASAPFQRKLETFRKSREIDYCAQWTARRQVLELLAQCFFRAASSRREDFERFIRERPEVDEYARFRATCERRGTSWHTWPTRLRTGHLNPKDYSRPDHRFHTYIQWLAHEQMQQVLQSCHAAQVKLYLDLPLGVHPDGFDMWHWRDVFATDVRVGAPPDVFFTKGQNWGFAPLHPRKSREQGYRYVLEYLRFHMRHTDQLRIDHVMGLHRLYWIPKGLPPDQGAYVHYPANELYALLCLESHRHKTTLVGENLGTVPPEVNANMKRHRLRTMYVLQYEQRLDPNQALKAPPVRCVASVNTHDMPTFASHWKGLDLLDRANLGLIPRGLLAKYRHARQRLNAALARFISRDGCLDPPSGSPIGPRGKSSGAASAYRACLRWLSGSRAEVVLVSLEDLWLEEKPQNVPGTSSERPNWRRKAKFDLTSIRTNPEIRAILAEINQIRLRLYSSTRLRIKPGVKLHC